MAKDTSKSQGDSGGDKSRNQPEKGNKIDANRTDHRHGGGSNAGKHDD